MLILLLILQSSLTFCSVKKLTKIKIFFLGQNDVAMSSKEIDFFLQTRHYIWTQLVMLVESGGSLMSLPLQLCSYIWVFFGMKRKPWNHFLYLLQLILTYRLCSVVWWHKNHTTPHWPHHTVCHHTTLYKWNLKGKNDLLFQILANNIYFLKFFWKWLKNH